MDRGAGYVHTHKNEVYIGTKNNKIRLETFQQVHVIFKYKYPQHGDLSHTSFFFCKGLPNEGIRNETDFIKPIITIRSHERYLHLYDRVTPFGMFEIDAGFSSSAFDSQH